MRATNTAGRPTSVAIMAAALFIAGACRGASLPPRPAGTVIAWGWNEYGQATVPANLTNVVGIAGGYGFSLALKGDGTLRAWGSSGNFGATVIPPQATNVIAIAAEQDHSLALRADGTVVAWGAGTNDLGPFDNYGQSIVPAGLNSVIVVAAGRWHSLALKADGTVVAWGAGSPRKSGWPHLGQSIVPPGLGNVVAVAGGLQHSLALLANGTVVGWGDNSYGQISVPPGLSDVVAIAAEGFFSLALKSNGTVVGWGVNNYGQVSIPSGLNGGAAIAAGVVHSMALRSNGTVVAWGNNDYGQTNVPLGLDRVTAIAGGEAHGLAIRVTGPTILSHPADQTVGVGGSATFLVSVSSAEPVSFQWRKGGSDIPAAANATLTITTVQLGDAGEYSVLVANAGGSAVSASAVLTVVPQALGLATAGRVLTSNSFTNRGPIEVSLLTTVTNATVFYTLDGSMPPAGARLYSGSFVLRRSATVRAIAYYSEFTQKVEGGPWDIVILPILTVTTLGGGAVSISPIEGPYLDGSNAVVTATPNPGWTFLHWLGAAEGSNPTISVAVNRDKCLEAVFGTTVNTTVAGSGSVNLYPTSALFPYGTTVRVSAVPQAGNHFLFWGNALSGSNTPTTLIVTNANPTVFSAFQTLSASRFSLTTLSDGRGAVVVSPHANFYTNGQPVVVTAAPEPEQEFLGWSGSASGVQNPLAVMINSNRIITAHFTKRPRFLLSTCGDGMRDSGFRFTVIGDFGSEYKIDGTSDLISWTPLATVTNQYGRVQLTDSNATNAPHRVYRATVLP